jgi:hypothetical protein
MSLIRKRWKSIIPIIVAVITSGGWAGREIYCAYKECNELKSAIIPKVDATAAGLADVKDEQRRRATAIERIPVIDERTARMEEQSRELAKEVKELRAGQSRIEGALDVLKRDKTVALEK